MWSIVLISHRRAPTSPRSLPGQEEHVSVFLPCTPNPTTGFFFYVPKRKVIEVDMTAEDAATLIMSAGMVQPGSAPTRRRLRRSRGHGECRAYCQRLRGAQPQPAKVE